MKRVLVLLIGALTTVTLCALLISACRPTYHAERPWGQGYETSAGYMQPDHGWAYYYLMNRLLWQDVSPTYHVYVPPPGYAPSYRPWYRESRGPVRQAPSPPANAVTPARATGGFTRAPAAPQPSPRVTAPSRTSGGFSKPAAPPPSRTSGGFSKPSSPATSRTSGGFSKPKGRD